jgi:hypothetical protein
MGVGVGARISTQDHWLTPASLLGELLVAQFDFAGSAGNLINHASAMRG